MVNTRNSWAARAAGLVAVTAALVLGAGAGTASAHGGGSGGSGGAPVILADGLAGPLQIDAGGGKVLVAQGFTGTISSIGPRGAVTDLVAEPGFETAAVAAGPFGSVFYARNNEEGQSELRVRDRNGATRTFADLGTYEATQNPDQVTTYGIDGGLSPECEAQWPSDQVGPPTYPGQVDSHPYTLAMTPFGVLVADAAANAILFVDWTGRVRTAAVLPAQPTLITADAAAANGLPECVVGRSYNFEPVPTDVEIGPRGTLFVTTLPGGPEDPSLGARGSVYRVNPFSGRSRLVATGFAGATNLAVAPDGTIYVAELFANRVSKVRNGAPSPVADVNQVAAVEWDRGALLVTADVFPTDEGAFIGKVLRIRP